jgi:hypothetical protein
VYGPDGRQWTVTRRPLGGVVARLLRNGGWVVEAVTEGPPAETRQWHAERGGGAHDLVDQVALAIRTGAAGPADMVHDNA